MNTEYNGINNVKFVTSVANVGSYLDLEQPQIAIVGKSNVGKSSFINAITNRNKLAKTSQSPGKTRLINYFSCENEKYYLVDLPGYGYAKTSKTAIERWSELIEGYLISGKVSHVLMLIDSRHEPSEGDINMIRWLQYYNAPYSIIATKIDKLPKSKVQQTLAQRKKDLGAVNTLMGVSSSEKKGLFEAKDRIEAIVEDYYDIRSGNTTPM